MNFGPLTTTSIYNEDGTNNSTGTIKDWDKLPMSEKHIVYKERKRLGVKFGGNNTGGKGANKITLNSNAANSNTINQLFKKKKQT